MWPVAVNIGDRWSFLELVFIFLFMIFASTLAAAMLVVLKLGYPPPDLVRAALAPASPQGAPDACRQASDGAWRAPLKTAAATMRISR